jgi:enoyl-CoA hydratase/carnithine racemase
MSDRVVYTLENGVADVRLNRPDKLNALDQAMFAALVEVGEELKANKAVRAVVLSGEGRGFCAGLDFGSFQQMAGGAAEDSRAGGAAEGNMAGGAAEGNRAGGTGGEKRKPAPSDLGRRGGAITNSGQQAVYVWTEMPAPVIAAVHGPALGGGCQLALGADIRIVAPDAQLSVLEIRWGLSPDMTGTQMLPRLVGLDVAKELTFTGRMVSGEEAVQIGLATKVSDTPRDDALALATEIAGKNPQAVRGAKALINMAGLVSLEDGFKAEERTIGGLIGTPNQAEAVKAFFEKRPAVFED